MRSLTCVVMAISIAIGPMAGSGLAGALEDDLAHCLGQPSWFTRVQCYDKATKAHGIAPLRPVAPPPGETLQPTSPEPAAITDYAAPGASGKWRVETAPGAQAGGRNVWLMLASDNAAANHASELVAADMALRCMDSSLDVMIWAGGAHFTSPQAVATGLDSGLAETLDWGASSDQEWAFHPAPREFIDAILGARRLSLSVDPSNAPPSTYDFDIWGLATIAAELKSACRSS